MCCMHTTVQTQNAPKLNRQVRTDHISEQTTAECGGGGSFGRADPMVVRAKVQVTDLPIMHALANNDDDATQSLGIYPECQEIDTQGNRQSTMRVNGVVTGSEIPPMIVGVHTIEERWAIHPYDVSFNRSRHAGSRTRGRPQYRHGYVHFPLTQVQSSCPMRRERCLGMAAKHASISVLQPCTDCTPLQCRWQITKGCVPGLCCEQARPGWGQAGLEVVSTCSKSAEAVEEEARSNFPHHGTGRTALYILLPILVYAAQMPILNTLPARPLLSLLFFLILFL